MQSICAGVVYFPHVVLKNATFLTPYGARNEPLFVHVLQKIYVYFH